MLSVQYRVGHLIILPLVRNKTGLKSKNKSSSAKHLGSVILYYFLFMCFGPVTRECNHKVQSSIINIYYITYIRVRKSQGSRQE